MSRQDTDAKPTRSRVSQNAPESRSTSAQAWADALSDPAFRPAVDEGLGDLRAGRTRPWSEIRRRTTSR